MVRVYCNCTIFFKISTIAGNNFSLNYHENTSFLTCSEVVSLTIKVKYTYLVVQLGAILQNTRPDHSELYNVGPTVRSARSVKQQSRVAKLNCSLDQPTQFGFSIKFCHPTGVFMAKKQRAFPSHCHKMNMASQKFAHGATHYCNFKRTALCENALYYNNKTTINKEILCRFQNNFFKD